MTKLNWTKLENFRKSSQGNRVSGLADAKFKWRDKITFGKYKGKLLKDIPVDYLRWVRDNSTIPDEPSKAGIELRRRKEEEKKNKVRTYKVL